VPELTAARSPSASRMARPRWLDSRLVLGLLLVLASVVLGAKIVGGADHYERVYAATHELSAGTTLSAADVGTVRVRFGADGNRYVSAGGSLPVGYVLDRAVGSNELLPKAALHAVTRADSRLVTVPVKPHHFAADLGHGQLVDVYVTAKPKSRETTPPPALVLGRVPVETVDDVQGSRYSGSSEAAVTLRTTADAVPYVVNALQTGEIDLIRVPTGATR
jgi:hypothetical protein